MCLNCFSVAAADDFPHRPDHPYRLVEKIEQPLFATEWTADEEIRLLEALSEHGPHHWKAVADYVGKTPKKCQTHYEHVYLDGPSAPLPSVRLDEQAQENAPNAMEMDTTETLDLAESENGKDCNTINERNPRKGAMKLASSAERDARKVQKKKHRKSGTLQGFMPMRGDFDVEYDDEAEQLIADISVSPTDSEEEMALKLRLLDMYNKRLDRRMAVKDFLFGNNLLDFASLKYGDRRGTREEKELAARLKIFSTLMAKDQFDAFYTSVMTEFTISKNIFRLAQGRKAGMRARVEADVYEVERKLRCQRLADDEKQRDTKLFGNATPVKMEPQLTTPSPTTPLQSLPDIPASPAPPSEDAVSLPDSNDAAIDVDGTPDAVKENSNASVRRNREKKRIAKSPYPLLDAMPVEDLEDVWKLTQAEKKLCSALHIQPKEFLKMRDAMLSTARCSITRSGGRRRRDASATQLTLRASKRRRKNSTSSPRNPISLLPENKNHPRGLLKIVANGSLTVGQAANLGHFSDPNKSTNSIPSPLTLANIPGQAPTPTASPAVTLPATPAVTPVSIPTAIPAAPTSANATKKQSDVSDEDNSYSVSAAYTNRGLMRSGRRSSRKLRQSVKTGLNGIKIDRDTSRAGSSTPVSGGITREYVRVSPKFVERPVTRSLENEIDEQLPESLEVSDTSKGPKRDIPDTGNSAANILCSLPLCEEACRARMDVTPNSSAATHDQAGLHLTPHPHIALANANIEKEAVQQNNANTMNLPGRSHSNKEPRKVPMVIDTKSNAVTIDYKTEIKHYHMRKTEENKSNAVTIEYKKVTKHYNIRKTKENSVFSEEIIDEGTASRNHSPSRTAGRSARGGVEEMILDDDIVEKGKEASRSISHQATAKAAVSQVITSNLTKKVNNAVSVANIAANDDNDSQDFEIKLKKPEIGTAALKEKGGAIGTSRAGDGGEVLEVDVQLVTKANANSGDGNQNATALRARDDPADMQNKSIDDDVIEVYPVSEVVAGGSKKRNPNASAEKRASDVMEVESSGGVVCPLSIDAKAVARNGGRIETQKSKKCDQAASAQDSVLVQETRMEHGDNKPKCNTPTAAVDVSRSVQKRKKTASAGKSAKSESIGEVGPLRKTSEDGMGQKGRASKRISEKLQGNTESTQKHLRSQNNRVKEGRAGRVKEREKKPVQLHGDVEFETLEEGNLNLDRERAGFFGYDSRSGSSSDAVYLEIPKKTNTDDYLEIPKKSSPDGYLEIPKKPSPDEYLEIPKNPALERAIEQRKSEMYRSPDTPACPTELASEPASPETGGSEGENDNDKDDDYVVVPQQRRNTSSKRGLATPTRRSSRIQKRSRRMMQTPDSSPPTKRARRSEVQTIPTISLNSDIADEEDDEEEIPIRRTRGRPRLSELSERRPGSRRSNLLNSVSPAATPVRRSVRQRSRSKVDVRGTADIRGTVDVRGTERFSTPRRSTRSGMERGVRK